MRRLSIKVLTVLFLGCLIVVLGFSPAFSQWGEPIGLVSMKSTRNVEETTKRLEGLFKERNLTLFAKVDHSAEAKSVGLELLPTRLLIFGNPRTGTPLMQCRRSVAIDLPMKALVWEDEFGQAWLSYNSANYLKSRHRLKGCDDVLERISQALNSLAKAATQP